MKPNNELRYCACGVRLSVWNRGSACFACRDRRIKEWGAPQGRVYAEWISRPLVVWPPDKSI
jgi:hypothetical protein